ncbi:TPA: acyltransferase [Enterobacter asburiae]|nr:acyltransferase [Enterobacter asburiae]HCR2223639.1 acyltransferase [Enterobacter asburiae]
MSVNDSNGAKRTINTIQALRGIAALMVVLVHFKVYFNMPFYNFGDSLFSYGGMGVPLFFIISGFVMTYTHNRTGVHESILFIIKRFSRVYPLYFISTILWLIVLKYSVPTAHEFDNSTDIIKSLLFYPLDARNAPNLGLSSLFVGWTLNYEMFFYAVFAASLAFNRWMWTIFSFAFMTILYIIPSIFSSFSFVTEVDYGFSVAYMSLVTNPIIINFLAGVLIAKLVNIFDFSKASKSSLTWLVFAVVTAFAWQYFSGFRAGWGFLQWGFVSAALVFVCVIYERRFGFVCAPLTYLGSISFSVYLLHPFVKELLQIIFIESGHEEYAGGPLMGLLIVSSTILVAHVSRNYIEVWLSNKVRDFLLTRSMIAKIA